MNAIKFSSLSHLKWKSMMITDKAVIFSNKDYSSLESMAKNLKAASAMEAKEEFWYHSLDELSYLENGESLTLKKLDYKSRVVSTTINVGDIEVIDQLLKAMLANEKFTKSTEKASVIKVAKASLIQAVIAGGITTLLYFAAVDMANGQAVDTSGRRSIIKKLLAAIIDVIGSTGVLIIGGGITLFLIYQLIRKLGNPPSLVIFKRVKSK